MKRMQVSEKLYDNQAGSRKDCSFLLQPSENHTAFSPTCMKRMQVSEKLYDNQAGSRKDCALLTQLSEIQTASGTAVLVSDNPAK
jgi:hypothetical protein